MLKLILIIISITFLAGYMLPLSKPSISTEYLGKDERFPDIETLENFDFELNFYRKELLKTLEDDRISRPEKILLIRDAHIILNELDLFNDFYNNDFKNGGLLDDWDFIID